MRTLLSILVVVLLIGLNSCKKDDKKAINCATWAADIQDEATEYFAAAMVFAFDQTTENCNAYKDAAQDYIDELEQYKDCDNLTAGEREELLESIADAEAELEDLNCNDL